MTEIGHVPVLLLGSGNRLQVLLPIDKGALVGGDVKGIGTTEDIEHHAQGGCGVGEKREGRPRVDERYSGVAACPDVVVAVEEQRQNGVVNQLVGSVEPPHHLTLSVESDDAAENGSYGHRLFVGRDGGAVDEQMAQLGVCACGPVAELPVLGEQIDAVTL